MANVLRRISGTRALLVTDRYMVDSGTVERVTKPLDAADISHDIFCDTVPDPTTDVVDAGVARLKGGDYDCLVALGGGSPIDTAKAMAVLAANGGRPGHAARCSAAGVALCSALRRRERPALHLADGPCRPG